jgi:hypothetical protein
MTGWLLLALLWGCASSQQGASKSGAAVSTPAKQGPGGKGLPASGRSAPGSTAPETPTNVTYFIHTVKWPGETVSIIAGWYTGDIQNWKILAEFNPDMDPNVVVTGQTIRIPEHIMTTRNPMTKAYVDSYYPKPHPRTRPTTQNNPQEKKDDSPPLYGPK